MNTLVAVGPHTINGQRYEHGAELPPGLLPRETIDQWLDRKWLCEIHPSVRRSLYGLFGPFSGCKEQEPLTQEELNTYGLPL
jgi:hypothetical protein